MKDGHDGFPVTRHMANWTTTMPGAAKAVSDHHSLRPDLHLTVPARPDQLAGIRARLGEWTRGLGLPEQRARDIVLAVDEAVTNSIEHAYPDQAGHVTVFAARDGQTGAVHVVISDTGTWRPQPADPGSRGRGLAIIGMLADSFDLSHDGGGTTIALGWTRS